MIIRQILKQYHKIEIELLLSQILKKPKEFLFINPEYELTRNQEQKLLRIIRRRVKGEPIAYIFGYKDFCGLRFKVSGDVLIPRPETEAIIERFKDLKHPFRILDVGTGSGCIAVSLAKVLFASPGKEHLCQSKIYASDISKKALKIARINAKAHKVIVKFIQSDLLKNIKFSPDIIIANLPYGWKEWKNNTAAETVGLRFEPKKALFTAEKGLFQIRRLLQQIPELPKMPSLVYLEFDPRQKMALAKLIKKYLPMANIKFYRDINNLWRFVEINLRAI